MANYHRVADENRFQFVPTVFSRTGQIHESIKRLIKEHICHKLICFEGEAKHGLNAGKMRSVRLLSKRKQLRYKLYLRYKKAPAYFFCPILYVGGQVGQAFSSEHDVSMDADTDTERNSERLILLYTYIYFS